MNKLKENANEILNLYNYFNAAIIFDKDAIAVYYFNNRHDINDLSEEEVIGKRIVYKRSYLIRDTKFERSIRRFRSLTAMRSSVQQRSQDILKKTKNLQTYISHHWSLNIKRSSIRFKI